jgi:hypothetical protein
VEFFVHAKKELLQTWVEINLLSVSVTCEAKNRVISYNNYIMGFIPFYGIQILKEHAKFTTQKYLHAFFLLQIPVSCCSATE